MTPEQQAIVLLRQRDALYEKSRTAPPPANGVGLSHKQWAYYCAAEEAELKAQALLARLHPAYRPPPWTLP